MLFKAFFQKRNYRLAIRPRIVNCKWRLLGIAQVSFKIAHCRIPFLKIISLNMSMSTSTTMESPAQCVMAASLIPIDRMASSSSSPSKANEFIT